MRRIVIVLACLICISSLVTNANQVTFKFSAGTIDAGTLKNKMENNISALLTEINRAGNARSSLNLSEIDIEPVAKARLEALWKDAPFVCEKSTNVSKCLNDFQGFQVRAIPITMKPDDSSYSGSLSRVLTISLSRSGVITGVRAAWEHQEDVTRILTSPSGVADTRQRREILKWIEDYKSFYHEKNIPAISQIFSDGNLMLNGSMVMQDESGGNIIGRNMHDLKAQYLSMLTQIFRRNESINVEFDHISVVMHIAKPNVYGVTLHQKWQTSTYSDDGWLFMLWDLNDPEKPQIRVRTWQPEQAVAKDGVFTLDDFYLP